MLPFASFGALTMCLLITGVMALVAWNLARLTDRWGGGGHMTIYLEDDAGSQRAAQIAEAVTHLPGVVGVQLVTSKEARSRLRDALGARGELLDGVEDGFLPASIDVRLKPGVGALLRAHPAFQRLSSAPGVEEVDLHAEVTERLERLRTLVVRGALALALLIVLGTLYMVAITIRLGVEARREELSVLRLVGATESFVRAPFLLEGLMAGALGAGLAALTLRGIYRTIAPRVAEDLGSWLSAAPLSFFPGQVVVIAIMAGALLGCVGAGAAFSMERA
jgi:cell division transport system permease protein